jgi:hypothetical protein
LAYTVFDFAFNKWVWTLAYPAFIWLGLLVGRSKRIELKSVLLVTGVSLPLGLFLAFFIDTLPASMSFLSPEGALAYGITNVVSLTVGTVALCAGLTHRWALKESGWPTWATAIAGALWASVWWLMLACWFHDSMARWPWSPPVQED